MLEKYKFPKGEMPPHFAFRIGHPTTLNEKP